MSGKVYPGRMFPKGKSDAFFDHGVGAMEWEVDKEGRRALWFLAPDVTGKRRWTLARIYMNRSATDWAVPGDVEGWDGNLERPTLHGSVWLRDKKGWHGFIKDGELVTA